MSNKIFDFNSANYNSFLEDFRNNPNQKRTIVLAGNFKENRTYALSQFQSETLSEVHEISLASYITKFEDESYEQIDALFEELQKVNGLIVFKDAEQLCGVYTGHTYSVVKYATPQEKYFIQKLKQLKNPAILEFNNEQHLDKAIIREADAVIRFPVPSSLLERIFFAITQFRINGSNLPSQRPV
ncbi:hypothetical protein [Balneola vulgaris]|jgi:hypothetical protein|uniref:hypothetical protein n=1 Tax=Balneola vulgaris TaxID=287535 RepID=UPI00035ED97A|nr:hypothetical protein [Balneola vulgaris]